MALSSSGSHSKSGSKTDSKAGVTGATKKKTSWMSGSKQRHSKGASDVHNSSSYQGKNSSASRERKAQELARLKKKTCHISMLTVLLIGGLVPFFATTFSTWYVLSDFTMSHMEFIDTNSGDAMENLIFSKLDSAMESEVEAYRAIYENVPKVVDAGVFFEYAASDYEREKKQERTAYWTQSIAEAYHYKNTFVLFSCTGHILGTGYDKDNKTFVAQYTDLHIFDYNTTDFTSVNYGNVYYDNTGCNTPDFFTQTTKETTHTKIYTDTTYWKNIFDPLYDSHTTTYLHDARLRNWYMDIRNADDDECLWTQAYPAYQIPLQIDDYVQTLVAKAFDSYGKYIGVVGVDISIDVAQDFIEELSKSFEDTSSLVLDKYSRVVASTHHDNLHIWDVEGTKFSELYLLQDYAERMELLNIDDKYLKLANYFYDNPNLFDEIQKNHYDLESSDVPHPEHYKVLDDDGTILVVSALHIVDHCGLDATIIIMTDESVWLASLSQFYGQIMTRIDTDTIVTLSGVGLTSLIALAGMLAVSRGVTKPLKSMSDDVTRLQELDFKGSFDKYRSYITELSHISTDYNGLKQCMARFRCFVPPQVIAEMLVEGKQTREVKSMYIATLFCDVANFTKVSHEADQEIVLEFANAFLGGCADIIVKCEGTVIDFFGDQIFAIFNAPVEDPNYQINTITAATKIIKLFDKTKRYFIQKDAIFRVLDVRIGLHCGSSIVGKVGSENRLKYCAIGENVNLGSRLESINKRYKSRMACTSDFLYAMPRDDKRLYLTRPMEFIRVRRREAPVLIYEIGGVVKNLKPEVIEEFREHTAMFERVRTKRVSKEELEQFIKNAPNSNARFLRSGTALSDSEI